MRKIFTIILILVAASIRSNAQGLVINEIDYDQPGADLAEFIELYNSGSTPIDLSNYAVVLVNGSNSTRYDSIALPSRMLASHAFFVICGGNGTVPNCDTVRTGFTIQNGSPDAVIIRDLTTLNIVDAVSYEGTVVGYSSGNGVPLAQSDTLNAGFTSNNFLGISRFPDGANTGDDSTDFNRRCTTPGMANINTTSGCLDPLAVKNISVKNGLSVYPNPSKGIVNVDMNNLSTKNGSLALTDILGNVLKTVVLKNSDTASQLDLSEFQDGIYFIKLKSDGGESIQRVILKK